MQCIQRIRRTLSATRYWCLQCTIICSSRTNSAAVHCRGGSTLTATISSPAAAAASFAFTAGFGAAAAAAPASWMLQAPSALPLLLVAVLLLLMVLVSPLLLGASKSLMRQPYTTPKEPARRNQQHGAAVSALDISDTDVISTAN
jgi:hypothetical protein